MFHPCIVLWKKTPLSVNPKPMPQLHPLVPSGAFDLQALLEHEPPTRWVPEEPGEGIEGNVVKIAETKAFGGISPVLFILVGASKLMTIRCGGVVLKGHLAAHKPLPGDRVAVKFHGMRTAASGRQYADYAFGIRRAL